MTLFDSSPESAVRSVYWRIGILVTLFFTLTAAVVLYSFRNRPAENWVNRFFAAVEAQDYSKAYGIWNNDPDWQKHAAKYEDPNVYPYDRFLKDWGSRGDYGLIKTHKILYSTSKWGNSVLVVVEVNERQRPLAVLSLGKKDHILNFAPFELTPQKSLLGWTFWQISYR
jgi:hypothetical protein